MTPVVLLLARVPASGDPWYAADVEYVSAAGRVSLRVAVELQEGGTFEVSAAAWAFASTYDPSTQSPFCPRPWPPTLPDVPCSVQTPGQGTATAELTLEVVDYEVTRPTQP